MLRLETLGGLILTDGDGNHLVPQRRRLALLALLAGAGERGMTRDKLVGVLWPESASENARHALEQLLYAVRREMPPVILGTDPLRLDPAAVTSDIQQFSRRLAEGDLGSAVALYQGPFLDGFFLQGAPEFERWAERERSRLEAEYARALRLLADQAEAGGRQTAEIDYRRQLAVTDPLGERAATELVRALAASGDWVGATRAARAYEERVREQLPGITPADLAGLVERLRRRHEVSVPADADTPGSSPAPYAIERELGRGAVATVYLARDRRFDRPVALKLLRPELATVTDARRFRREIAILARLYHPHILQLYDSGVLTGEGPAGLYYVMPYVRGESRSGSDSGGSCGSRSRPPWSWRATSQRHWPTPMGKGSSTVTSGRRTSCWRPGTRSWRISGSRASWKRSEGTGCRRRASCSATPAIAAPNRPAAPDRSMAEATSTGSGACCTRCWPASRRSAGRPKPPSSLARPRAKSVRFVPSARRPPLSSSGSCSGRSPRIPRVGIATAGELREALRAQ